MKKFGFDSRKPSKFICIFHMLLVSPQWAAMVRIRQCLGLALDVAAKQLRTRWTSQS